MPGPEYTLRFTEPAQHRVDVEMTIAADGTGELELWMPVWTPGSYLVREYSRNVEEFRAEARDGKPLPWRKTRKNRWVVRTGGATEVRITYRLFCHEKSVRTNWVDSDYAFLIGAGTFFTVRGRETAPHRLRIEKPLFWSSVWTSLPEEDGRYTAADLDELVDSPILVGNQPAYAFEVDGKPVALVNQGEGGLWDGARAAEDTEKIVRWYGDMFGGFPFERYLFLNLIVEGRGGLEHKDCSVLMASRYAYRDRKAYADWLGLVSHEFFHVWNVKRSRPVALGPFDYENEVYTRSLWVAEGLTAYYTDLVPCRAGVTTVEEYFDFLGTQLQKLDGVPGRALQSLEDSSFDAWIKLYRPDENTQNSTVSYYLKGAVVGWLLDAEIRRVSGDARSLDDLMRLLFERHSGERGFTDEEVQQAAEEVAGGSLQAFFDHAVRSTRELDLGPALEGFGLRFRKPEDGDSPQGWVGIERKRENAKNIVTFVRRGGPAWQAGLNAGDEILAMGGYRVTADNYLERLKQYRPGDRVEILVARDDMIRIVPITLGERPKNTWRVEFDPDASPEAVARRTAWLGRET